MSHPYSSETYARALAGDAGIVSVPGLETWAILREVPGCNLIDATGPYPFTPLSRPRSAQPFRRSLRDLGAISFVAVTDSLQDATWLSEVFDSVRPYKLHYVIDRQVGPARFSKHHRQEIKKAQGACDTRRISLLEYLDDWCALYAASSDQGYDHGAAYAVYAEAIGFFHDRRFIDLGGVPDVVAGTPNGLAQFKKGFANQTRSNLICGAVVDSDAYTTLCRDAGVDPNLDSYFPAYRAADSANVTPQPGLSNLKADPASSP